MDDTPQLRQLYHNNHCFRKIGVRLESLNFVLKYLKSQEISFVYENSESLSEIKVNGINIIFVYKYCLNKAFLYDLCPKPNRVIVNLHNWNGKGCISQEALDAAKTFGVILLTQEEFYEYVKEI